MKRRPKSSTLISVTSLMDALTIILFFLMVNFQATSNTAQELPQLLSTQALHPDQVVLTLEKDSIKTQDQEVSLNQVRELKLPKGQPLSIQADKDLDYTTLEGVLTQLSTMGHDQVTLLAKKRGQP